MQFGFLGRRPAIGMEFGQSLITSIRKSAGMWCQCTVAVLEQLKIMLTTKAEVCRKDFFCVQVGNQLRFLGVTLLFAAVVPALSFFGRSIGCSVASTSTISIKVSLDCRAFLPGR